ncbi:MAG: hypothetical protein U9R44_03410 [Candidatus Omnitrophota bacterium]|nr:hypothetical protein [Candidatus Omnitrophota bacterium]
MKQAEKILEIEKEFISQDEQDRTEHECEKAALFLLNRYLKEREQELEK